MPKILPKRTLPPLRMREPPLEFIIRTARAHRSGGWGEWALGREQPALAECIDEAGDAVQFDGGANTLAAAGTDEDGEADAELLRAEDVGDGPVANEGNLSGGNAKREDGFVKHAGVGLPDLRLVRVDLRGEEAGKAEIGEQFADDDAGAEAGVGDEGQAQAGLAQGAERLDCAGEQLGWRVAGTPVDGLGDAVAGGRGQVPIGIEGGVEVAVEELQPAGGVEVDVVLVDDNQCIDGGLEGVGDGLRRGRPAAGTEGDLHATDALDCALLAAAGGIRDQRLPEVEGDRPQPWGRRHGRRA